MYNKGTKELRPFLGVLFEINQIEYFVPLTSPKAKHKKMHNTLDFMKINNGEYGAINFNNMIPVSKDCYQIIDLTSSTKIKDKKYYHLLINQLVWLNKNQSFVIRHAQKLYDKYLNNNLPIGYKDRCCNFPLLEEKCLEYNKNNVLV